jgi:hypothetical protein
MLIEAILAMLVGAILMGTGVSLADNDNKGVGILVYAPGAVIMVVGVLLIACE